MNVKFQCPGCKQTYSAPDSMAGMTKPCKKCGMAMVVPSPASASPPRVSPPPLPQAGPRDLTDLLDDVAASPSPLPPAPPVGAGLPDSLEAELTDRRSRKQTREKSARRTGLALMLIMLGAVGLGVGYRERRLSSLAKSTPQRISLTELAANGPGDNIWLDLTDFQLLLDQAVIETEERTGITTRRYAWIPAVPLGNFRRPRLDRINVIIGTKEADDDRLENLARQPVLRGIIVNATDSLGSEERKLLNEGLRGVDAAACYFFRVGQGPTSAAWHFFLLGGGLIALLAGLALGAYELKVRIFGRG